MICALEIIGLVMLMMIIISNICIYIWKARIRRRFKGQRQYFFKEKEGGEDCRKMGYRRVVMGWRQWARIVGKSLDLLVDRTSKNYTTVVSCFGLCSFLEGKEFWWCKKWKVSLSLFICSRNYCWHWDSGNSELGFTELLSLVLRMRFVLCINTYIYIYMLIILTNLAASSSPLLFLS